MSQQACSSVTCCALLPEASRCWSTLSLLLCLACLP